MTETIEGRLQKLTGYTTEERQKNHDAALQEVLKFFYERGKGASGDDMVRVSLDQFTEKFRGEKEGTVKTRYFAVLMELIGEKYINTGDNRLMIISLKGKKIGDTLFTEPKE